MRFAWSKVTTIALGPQPDELKPLPAPLQAANCRFCELKSFRNPHSFNPKHLAAGRNRQNQHVTPFPRNLLVAEEILQFNRATHAHRLKSVSRLPMPQQNLPAD